MPRKRKSEPIGIGYTAKQMRKKKPINNEYLEIQANGGEVGQV